MKRLLIACLTLSCASPPPDPPAPPPGLASAPSRWVTPKPAGDDALWTLPARVQTEAASQGEISTLVLGRLDTIHVRPGDRIAAGAVVAELFAPDAIRHAAAYRSAQAQLRLARGRVSELRRLRREGLAATGQAYDARRQLAELDAQAAAAKAHLRAAGITPDAFVALADGAPIALRSPLAGVVRSVAGRVGAVHGPEDGPVVEVVGVGAARVEVRVTAPLPAAARLVFAGPDGQRVALNPAPVGAAPHPDGLGQLMWFAPSAPDVALSGGVHGVLRITPVGADLYAVPGAALLTRAGQMQIAVRRAEVERWQPVEVLRAGGSTAVIRAPLTPDDTVAADARRVLAQQAATP